MHTHQRLESLERWIPLNAVKIFAIECRSSEPQYVNCCCEIQCTPVTVILGGCDGFAACAIYNVFFLSHWKIKWTLASKSLNKVLKFLNAVWQQIYETVHMSVLVVSHWGVQRICDSTARSTWPINHSKLEPLDCEPPELYWTVNHLYMYGTRATGFSINSTTYGPVKTYTSADFHHWIQYSQNDYPPSCTTQ